MKLLRHGPPGGENPGLLDDRRDIRDLSDKVPDIDGATLAPERLAVMRRIDQVFARPHRGKRVFTIDPPTSANAIMLRAQPLPRRQQ